VHNDQQRGLSVRESVQKYHYHAHTRLFHKSDEVVVNLNPVFNFYQLWSGFEGPCQFIALISFESDVSYQWAVLVDEGYQFLRCHFSFVDFHVKSIQEFYIVHQYQ